MPRIPIDISVIANGEWVGDRARFQLFEEHAAASEEIRLAA
jgi:hypothetical protein